MSPTQTNIQRSFIRIEKLLWVGSNLRGRVESPNVPLPYTEILIQLFGPKRVTQLLNYDIIEFPEEGYLLHFKLEFPEGDNHLLYSCAY